ncbi:uncharacterized protein LOC123222806 [Mangifera indica]|uniref:uncharacterized protein LOC123222806 n=1 Tax=Mangifera indica TaxID=29780 RepID=UPI001CFAA8C7|nr:uncharacterized protein LOC123222806 [Mangifera indica]
MAAAGFLDEEEVWKCQKHPSKRHRSGVCPTCLRDRLSSLCPDCANVRPCACSAITTSSSSSSSSSFSRFSLSGGENFSAGIGTVGRVSNLIDSEPALRRSRSLAVPFLRSKSKYVENLDFVGNGVNNESRSKTTTVSFWWWLKGGNKNSKSNRGGDLEEERRMMMMKKSRSAAVSRTSSDYGKPKGAKWYFPSPIKVFRQSRLPKEVVQLRERSPMYRG